MVSNKYKAQLLQTNVKLANFNRYLRKYRQSVVNNRNLVMKGKIMKYVAPYGIEIKNEDNASSINKLADSTYLAEVIKTAASSMKTGGLKDLKVNEQVEAIGRIYLSVYIAKYDKRNAGIIFTDDTMAHKKSISVPSIVAPNADSICEKLQSADSLETYLATLKSVIQTVKKLDKKKYEFTYLVNSGKVIQDLNSFLLCIDDGEEFDSTGTESLSSKIDSEANSVHELLKGEDFKLAELLSDINRIKSTVIDTANGWANSLEDTRKAKEEELDRTINDMVNEFDHETLPRLEAERDRNLATLQSKNDAASASLVAAREDADFYRDIGTKGVASEADSTASKYRNQVNEIKKQSDEVVSSFNKAVNREKRMIQAKRDEKDSINNHYQKLKDSVLDMSQEYQSKSQEYVSNSESAIQDIFNQTSTSLDLFKNGFTSLGYAQVLIPVYIVKLIDQKKGKGRFVVVPPIKFESGKIKAQKEEVRKDVLGKFKDTFRSESLYDLIKNKTDHRLDHDVSFRKSCLDQIKKYSITNPVSSEYQTAKEGIENLKQNGSLKEKELAKIESFFK